MRRNSLTAKSGRLECIFTYVEGVAGGWSLASRLEASLAATSSGRLLAHKKAKKEKKKEKQNRILGLKRAERLHVGQNVCEEKGSRPLRLVASRHVAKNCLAQARVACSAFHPQTSLV